MLNFHFLGELFIQLSLYSDLLKFPCCAFVYTPVCAYLFRGSIHDQIPIHVHDLSDTVTDIRDRLLSRILYNGPIHQVKGKNQAALWHVKG